jgi:hypothetical protein
VAVADSVAVADNEADPPFIKDGDVEMLAEAFSCEAANFNVVPVAEVDAVPLKDAPAYLMVVPTELRLEEVEITELESFLVMPLDTSDAEADNAAAPAFTSEPEPLIEAEALIEEEPPISIEPAADKVPEALRPAAPESITFADDATAAVALRAEAPVIWPPEVAEAVIEALADKAAAPEVIILPVDDIDPLAVRLAAPFF